MSFAALNTASLLNSLKSISIARTERECTEAIVAGATMLQQAVFHNLDPQELAESLNEVPAELCPMLNDVVDRAVNLHHVEDGTLGLWLLPVAVYSDVGFQAPVSLGTGLDAMRTGALLVDQLGLSSKQLGSDKGGWVYTVPTLFTAGQLSQAEFGDLVRLPGAAREVVQGSLKKLDFALTTDDCQAGGNMLYLPFVAYSPVGQEGVFELSKKVEAAASKWIRSSLAANGIPAESNVSIIEFPRPYTAMMTEAPIQVYAARLRNSLDNALKAADSLPHALVAHLAPSVKPQAGGDQTIGISLRSRHTRQVMGYISMPTLTESAWEEMSESVGLMRSMGFARVMVNQAPANPRSCHGCKGSHMQMPPDVLTSLVVDAPDVVH